LWAVDDEFRNAVLAGMATPKGTAPDAASLVATAVAQAFGLFAAVLIAADVSGGHANPAVTFALALGGHVAAASAVFYWASQMLGGTFACLVLHYISAGQARTTSPRRSPFSSLHSPLTCFYFLTRY
jgi:aquaporin TIP